MSLSACGSIHEGHEWLSDDSRGRENFYCVSNLPIREWRYQDISIKSYFMRSFYFLSVFSSSEVLAKITSIRSKLPTAACWSWEEKRGNALACFMLKATSVPQTPQTNHSQYSSSLEALNLIVDSNSQPVEIDNSTIQLHVPFWFPCFNAIWYDLWCHVAWGLKFWLTHSVIK